MDTCTVEGCRAVVSRAGHTLCKPHWLAQKAGKLTECVTCGVVFETSPTGCPHCSAKGGSTEAKDEDARLVSSTKLGATFGITARRMNLVLAELGWIERGAKGWKPTPQGLALGGIAREQRQTGVPYVVWPSGLISNRALTLSLKATKEGADDVAEAPVSQGGKASPSSTLSADFRSRFPPKFRTKDGHMVRSRGEMLIDNFLYDQGIVHAYERRLPITEDCYSDFYLPEKKVYLEYWGLEGRSSYENRKAEKKALYAKHGFSLLEVTDDHIAAPDDELPKLLLKFGIACT